MIDYQQFIMVKTLFEIDKTPPAIIDPKESNIKIDIEEGEKDASGFMIEE